MNLLTVSNILLCAFHICLFINIIITFINYCFYQHYISVMHLWWEVVTYILPYTTNQMRFIQDRYYYETTGLENNPSRSLHCAEVVNSMMGMAVSYVLVDMESVDHNKQMVLNYTSRKLKNKLQ